MDETRPSAFAPVPEDVEQVAAEIVDAAIRVHSELGPGLLEGLYQQALAHELALRGREVEREVPVSAKYRGVDLDGSFRLDLLVEDAIVVEVKAVEQVLPVHEAQLLTYLRLTENRLGFLLNFHVDRMKEGIDRMIL